jgi:hypothetical protein
VPQYGSAWLSDNPDKAWGEKLFLSFIPVFVIYNAVIQSMGWLDAGTFWHVVQNAAMWFPYCVVLPAWLRRSSGVPWSQSYWFKLNLYMAVWVFFATYYHTEYFFELLGLRYRFPSVHAYFDSALVGPNEATAAAEWKKVPVGMYLNSIAFFIVYHSAAVVSMRRVRRFTVAWSAGGAARGLGGDRRGRGALLRVGGDLPLHHRRRGRERLVRRRTRDAALRLDLLRDVLHRQLSERLPARRGSRRAALDALAHRDRGVLRRDREPHPARPLGQLHWSDHLMASSLRSDYSGAFDPEVGLQAFSRQALATLGREYLLNGHLQDRVGMPKVVIRHGLEPQVQIAIEEWMASSPIYSLRAQRALNFVGNDVSTVFKNLQLDIGRRTSSWTSSSGSTAPSTASSGCRTAAH